MPGIRPDCRLLAGWMFTACRGSSTQMRHACSRVWRSRSRDVRLVGPRTLSLWAWDRRSPFPRSNELSALAPFGQSLRLALEFSWNEVTIVNQERYLLVKFYGEQDITLYDDIVDFYINNESYYDYPDWTDYCYVYTISTGNTSYQLYDYSTAENKEYFTLLAYNSSGNYLVSNSIYF